MTICVRNYFIVLPIYWVHSPGEVRPLPLLDEPDLNRGSERPPSRQLPVTSQRRCAVELVAEMRQTLCLLNNVCNERQQVLNQRFDTCPGLALAARAKVRDDAS